MLRPIVHFLLIGAVLFVADQYRAFAATRDAGEAPRAAIVVEPGVLDTLRRESLVQTGRLPDDAALEARLQLWIDDEILFQEALRVGLDRGDPVVRNRLVRNMRFLEETGEDEGDDDALYQEALALGMVRSDIVVRRRLVQQMRFLIEAAARLPEPSDEDLRDYRDRNRARYEIPERVRLSHVYLSRDRRGDALDRDARALLARLREQDTPPEDAAALGDPFLHPAHLGLQSERQLAGQLGPGFAAEAMRISASGWVGPIESAYGAHLVWMHERRAAALPELASLRTGLRSALLAEQGKRAIADELVRLRAFYVIDRSAAGSS